MLKLICKFDYKEKKKWNKLNVTSVKTMSFVMIHTMTLNNLQFMWGWLHFAHIIQIRKSFIMLPVIVVPFDSNGSNLEYSIFYFFFFNIYWHHLSLSACGFVYMSWKWNDTQQSSPLTSTLHISSKWLVSDKFFISFFSFNLRPSIYSFSILFLYIYIYSFRKAKDAKAIES